MDELLRAIQAEIEKQGLSESAASRMATGNPSAIKNLRVRRGRSRSHPIENLLKVADALGLELYLGPPRAGPEHNSKGFAEAAQAALIPTMDGSPEALRMGYMPIPYHQQDHAHRGAAPVALARAWIDEQALDIERLSFLAAPDDVAGSGIAGGDLLLIDGAAKTLLSGQLWACVLRHRLSVARLYRTSTGAILALDRQEEFAAGECRVLGKVVWRCSKVAAQSAP